MKKGWMLATALVVMLVASGASAAPDPGAAYTVLAKHLDLSGGGGGGGPNPNYPNGFTDIGNHCDDCATSITFPFPIEFYGEAYTSGSVSSNGNLQFAGNSNSLSNACLPSPDFGPTIMVFQGDFRTNGDGDAIRTSVTGSAPNRIFVIDWRVHVFVSASTASFTLWFHEGRPGFETYWNSSDHGSTAVVGAQASSSGPVTQYSCKTSMDPDLDLLEYESVRTLTATKSGEGTGSVTSSATGINCGTTCSYKFRENSVVTLTAQADANSFFTGWGGGGCSGTGTCSVTMDVSKSVNADFAPGRTLTVAKDGLGSGTVTSSPSGIDCGVTCTAGFAHGTSVTLTAQPNSDSTFAGWSGGSGDCVGTAPDCTVTMDQPRDAVAIFEPIEPPTCPGFENDPRNQVVGTSAVELLEGTSGADIICGLGEEDKIRSMGGNDLIMGGGAADKLVGGGGNDIVKGGGGNDWMVGGGGKDRLNGGRNKDIAEGGLGRDVCRAEIKKSCEA
jgi:hypothetical protein